MTPHVDKPPDTKRSCRTVHAQWRDPRHDPAAVVTDDLTCRGCGYNLRGLSYGGQCPECGGEVERSAAGEILRYANVSWLRRVLLGAGLLAVTDFVALVTAIIGAVIEGEAFLFGPASAVLAVFVLVLLLRCIAIWLMTAGEMTVPGSRGAFALATLSRACAAALVLGVVGYAVVHGMGLYRGQFALWHVVLMLAGLNGEPLHFAYLIKLIDRLPSADLTRTARFFLRALSICLPLFAVLVLAAVSAPGMGIFQACGAVLVGWVTVLLWIPATIFYWNFGAELSQLVEEIE